MTVVLFLTSLTLATLLGWLSCALMTARTVATANRHAHRCQAREHRLLAEADAQLHGTVDAWRGYMARLIDERDEALRVRDQALDDYDTVDAELKATMQFLAVVAP